ncbi:Cupin domain protein [compost metagenome]
MRLTHLLVAAAAVAAFAGFAQAQEVKPHAEAGQAPHSNDSWKNGIQRTDLVHKDLAVPGHEVIQARVDIAPGVSSPKHSHPGVEVAYVIEGTFEYQLEGQPPVTLKAGESLYIPAGTPHIATNHGETKASELATYIVRKGEPLLKLEK